MPYREKMLQKEKEIVEFLAILKTEGVRSYLEIGSMWGGSLWRIGNSLPTGSRLVSIDDFSARPECKPSLIACVEALRDLGQDAHAIVGDNRSAATVERARALGPYDCILIDSDHTAFGVASDWTNYGSMGRLVAFHDISWTPAWRSKKTGEPLVDFGVPALWNVVKVGHRYKEIRYKPNICGIGVLWQ